MLYHRQPPGRSSPRGPRPHAELVPLSGCGAGRAAAVAAVRTPLSPRSLCRCKPNAALARRPQQASSPPEPGVCTAYACCACRGAADWLRDGAERHAQCGARAFAPERGQARCRGSNPPAHLDGTLPGDFGWDPLGLGADPDRLKWFAEVRDRGAKQLTPASGQAAQYHAPACLPCCTELPVKEQGRAAPLLRRKAQRARLAGADLRGQSSKPRSSARSVACTIWRALAVLLPFTSIQSHPVCFCPQSERVHCRWAMLAVAGILVQEIVRPDIFWYDAAVKVDIGGPEKILGLVRPLCRP